MPTRRLQERLLLAFVAVAAGVLLPAIFLLQRWMGEDVRDAIEDSLRREVVLLAGELTRHPPDDLVRWTNEVGTQTARVTVIATDGRVLADSTVSPDGVVVMDNHGDRSEVMAALRGEIGVAHRRSHTFSRNFVYMAAPVGAPPRQVVRVAMKVEELDTILGRPVAGLWLVGLVGLVMAGFIGSAVGGWLSRPLRAMSSAARAMSHGNFAALLPEPPNDEIGDLVHALETLRSQLAERIDELRTEGKKLRTILNGMDEGVALIQEGSIAVANPAFSRLLGAAESVEGRGPLEVSRLPIMAEAVEQALAGNLIRREVQVGARSLMVQAHPLAAGQAVLVLFDATEMRRLERMRRDFVANASHELRTPVAAIVGVADTLVAGAAEDPEARQSFVDILARHARRLERLTADLLDIARLEAGYKPRMELVPVDGVVEAVVSSLRGRAEEKRIALQVAQLPQLTVRAERAAVEQILSNFLDNALKYTPDGGRVQVGAQALGQNVRLVVEDSGPGIEAPHLARIFERFYRVDSARSRELGGTGLGLSIVKHLALANGGDVGVESQVGRGSRFYVDLPKA